MAILSGLSLISFNPDDPSLNISKNPLFDARPANFIGFAGAYTADMFFQLWGYSAFLIPIFLGIYAFYWLASWRVQSLGVRLSGMILMLLTLSVSLSVAPVLPPVRGHLPAGGLLGIVLADELEASLNPLVAVIVLASAVCLSLFLATTFSFVWAAGILQSRFHFVPALLESWTESKTARLRQKELKQTESKKEKSPKSQTIFTEKSSPSGRGGRDSTAVAPGEGLALPRNIKSSKPVPHAPEFPSLTLLRLPAAAIAVDEDELRERARLIEKKVREFEAVGAVQKIHPGPVVTTFEFKPEPGVKYSRITSLGDDLCLALEAESVRIDRIPGKSTVGIEVPNDDRATIVLRELLESPDYQHNTYRLPLALGKDITGRIVVSDLQKMPHLLAAGSTGTGKSVSINAMILSLLFRSRPDQVKMILIDPKRLELGLYQDIPHLLVPVVTEPKIAQNALKWAVTEMEARYKKLADRGVRNLEVYNEHKKQLPIPGFSDESSDAGGDRERLPYIVIVIDELADLMMTAPREVEESITRLAQMARAVGIHLILATQRPSVDVITGLIKANFPARISFRVASKVDSRTILDSNGSESLLGRGDMLYLPAGSARLHRIHGPLVSEDEIVSVCDFWRQQAQAKYNEQLLEAPKDEKGKVEGAANGEAGGEGADDDLYQDAVRVVCEMGRASTSTLQRRLRIGYGRAAHLIDIMEKDGIVGPPDGTRPREVLKGKSWMKEYDESMQ